MDIFPLIDSILSFTGILLPLIVAVFMLAQKDAKGFTHILAVAFFVAALVAISSGGANDVFHSSHWTLQFFQFMLLLVIIVLGLKLAITATTVLLLAGIYFIFLSGGIFWSNLLGAIIWILVQIIFIRGTILTVRHWLRHPDNPATK